jgi:hypothetical protein
MPTFDTQKIDAFLQALHANPVDTMQQLPPKYDAAGNEMPVASPANADDASTVRWNQERDELRGVVIGQDEATRAPYAANDNPRNLVDTFVHETLPAIEAAGLKAARLETQPWSGDYWATANGSLGNRYAGCMAGGWKEGFDYIRNHPSKVILNSGSAVWVNELSPAEKYDALVGDSSETLTRMAWLEGKDYFDKHGEVPGWFGICHGWSPASFMLPRPANSVQLVTPNNIKLTFFPCEIKALASLLWAKAKTPSRFIGGRCNTEKPAFDPATGRVITLLNPFVAADYPADEPVDPTEPVPGTVEVTLSTETWNEETGEPGAREGGRPTAGECVDSNPGAWHLAVVNQIGVSKRSMVLDASFDYQVWNQPMLGYKYTYFNPQTLAQTDVLAQASVSRAAFTSDIFKQYRSPKAATFVGIVMRVTYMGENGNEQVDTDAPDKDSVIDVDYYYDLELDSSGKIIGGEWYTNSHPDFLWTPPKGARAVSRYENLATGAWQAGQAVPASWRAAAVKASADLTPLAVIVEQMIKFANTTH